MSRARDFLQKSVAEFDVPGPLIERVRPAKGGWSLGFAQGSGGGTLGCLVRDRKDAAKLYILTTIVPQEAQAGDALLQPGANDGGSAPQDVIATLDRFIRPSADSTDNLDVALGLVSDPGMVSPEIEGIGYLTGVGEPQLGATVMKVGRTTGLTVGQLNLLNGTVNIGYGASSAYRFQGTIITDGMSQGGDAGAILVDEKRRALGILLGGSNLASVYLPIRRVLDALNVSLITE